jgi:hypothetical protein
LKVSISGVCERDLDLFLIEELVADHNLLTWLFKRCDLGEPVADKTSFTHSATTGNGESDVEIRATLTDGRSVIMLVENKVAASFQPRQAERYRERAEDFCRNGVSHSATTVLFAPAAYIGGNPQNHGFDATLSYEELRDWIGNRSDRDARSRYKEMLLQAAIEKSGRGFSGFDDVVSSFHRRYRELVCELEPHLKMNELKGNPSGSTFIQFRATGLPKGLCIVHKVDRGFVDLEVGGWGGRVHELMLKVSPLIEEGATIEKASKSAAIRLHVPCLYVARSPDGQLEDMKHGIAAAGRMRQWCLQNVQALGSILTPTEHFI